MTHGLEICDINLTAAPAPARQGVGGASRESAARIKRLEGNAYTQAERAAEIVRVEIHPVVAERLELFIILAK